MGGGDVLNSLCEPFQSLAELILEEEHADGDNNLCVPLPVMHARIPLLLSASAREFQCRRCSPTAISTFKLISSMYSMWARRPSIARAWKDSSKRKGRRKK